MTTRIVLPNPESTVVDMLVRYYNDRELLVRILREVESNARADHADFIIPRATYDRMVATLNTINQPGA